MTTVSLGGSGVTYTVRVTATPRNEQWVVTLELVGPTGAAVAHSGLLQFKFATAAAAETAGWHVANEWLQRVRGALTDEDRSQLMHCDHFVARCDTCVLSHRFFELVRDRYCARCRADLSPRVRLHLFECPDLALRRAEAAIRRATPLATDDGDTSDSRHVAPVEIDHVPAVPRRGHRRGSGTNSESGRNGCGICRSVIVPGERVSFQHGSILHLECYESRGGVQNPVL